jgi:DNA (cytosine-5)-methyltransferase 1
MKRDDFTLPLGFEDELIIDNFAGGGGTSTGLEAAFGRPVDIAINHDPEALAMHAINHPHTQHICQSVWDVDPIQVTRNQPVALVWLSPDCKHFSKAKGGTPVAKHIRGLAWVGMRWIARCKPRAFMLENVEEFTSWGPLIVGTDGNARPDPMRRGKTFESFIRQLRAHGYVVEWKELRACDNGAPTIRKRLFLVARRDGLPIIWPDQTHGAPTTRAVIAGKLAAYRTAAECIDFHLPSNSIFDRKKDLAVNTQRRVAKGLWRHVLTSASPFIVNTRNGERPGQEPRVRGVDEPYWTVTGLGSQGAVAQPVITPFLTEHANSSNQRTMAANEPLRTQCAQVKGGHFSVVAPTLATLRGTSESHLGGHDVNAPLSTVSAGGTHHALVAAHLTHLTHHGERSGHSPAEPLPTVTAAHRGEQALVSAFLEQANGGFNADNDGRPIAVPISTITGRGTQQRLVSAYCVKYYSSGGQWQGLAEPMHTLPTKGRMGLVEVVQVPVDCLAPEQRARASQCAQLLHTHLPEHFPEPAELVLVAYAGQWWVLVDITLRMLKPRELYRAQGFPESYVIHEIPDPALLFVDGRQASTNPLELPRIPLTATAQVRMCGNSVSPLQAEALVRSNFGHERLIHGRNAA